jgi:hypothetical protein
MGSELIFQRDITSKPPDRVEVNAARLFAKSNARMRRRRRPSGAGAGRTSTALAPAGVPDR